MTGTERAAGEGAPAPAQPRLPRRRAATTAAAATVAVAGPVATAVVVGLVGVLLAGSCEKMAPCRPDTVFLAIELDDDVARAADTLAVNVLVAGETLRESGPLAKPDGRAHLSLEIGFSSGYPAGKRVGITVTPLRQGIPLGAARTEERTLGAGCELWLFHLGGGDAGTDAAPGGTGGDGRPGIGGGGVGGGGGSDSGGGGSGGGGVVADGGGMADAADGAVDVRADSGPATDGAPGSGGGSGATGGMAGVGGRGGTGGTGGAGGRAGTGGSVPGTGGSVPGTGGSVPGTGGRATGTGGRAGTGGSATGTGGRAGTGGAPGTGGRAGTGGATGTGGSSGGTGGMPACTPLGGNRACGNCGVQMCGPTGWSLCMSEGICAAGASGSCGCGGTQICETNCTWGACAGEGPRITCYADTDGDTYGNGSVQASFCAAAGCGTGYVADATDCDDGNGDAHPQQMLYFATARANGSFDYNCNNTDEKNPSQEMYNGVCMTVIPVFICSTPCGSSSTCNSPRMATGGCGTSYTAYLNVDGGPCSACLPSQMCTSGCPGLPSGNCAFLTSGPGSSSCAGTPKLVACH